MNTEISTSSPISNFSTKLLNEDISPRFKDLKSAGTSFLPSERNARLVNNLNLNKLVQNYESGDNKLSSLILSSSPTTSSNLQETLFQSSNTN
jgi:hypothetical protein